MAKKRKAKASARKAKSSGTVDESTLWGLVGFALGILGFILVLVLRPKDDYAMYYAKQGLVLMVVAIVAYIISAALIIVIIGLILVPLVSILTFIAWIVGIVYSLSGKKKDLPLIGEWAKKINL